MNCDECQDRLQEYVDEEMSVSDKEAMDAHMGSCQECARLHRKIAQFTTTMVKAVGPVKPQADFSTRVLTRFTERHAEMQGVSEREPSAPGDARTYPVWPFGLGVVLLVGVGLFLLFSGSPRNRMGAIVHGEDEVRVLAYEDGAWMEKPGCKEIHSGELIEVEESGSVVRVAGGPGTGSVISLQSPCKAQFMQEGRRWVVAPWAESAGPVLIQTRPPSGSAADVSSVRVTYGQAYAEVKCGSSNCMNVRVGERNELIVSVKTGSAKVGNRKETQTLAAGFATTVLQKGGGEPIKQVEPDAFDWAGY